MQSNLYICLVVLLLIGCRDFVEKKIKHDLAEEVKKSNKESCEKAKLVSFEGVVDSVYLNRISEYELKLKDGRVFSIFPLEHSRHLLKDGDLIEKPIGKFEFIVKPYDNIYSSYVIKREDNFDCNYWDTLRVLNNYGN